MGEYDYEIDNLKKAYIKSMADDKAILTLWSGVKFCFKKDGTPFANLDKCFDGATYRRASYTKPNEGRYMLDVHGHCVYDSINGYIGLESATPEQKKRTDRIYNDNHYPVYVLTFEELRNRIYDKIARLQKKIDAEEYLIEHIEYIYNHYMEQLKSANKELKMLCNYSGSCIGADIILESAQKQIRWL